MKLLAKNTAIMKTETCNEVAPNMLTPGVVSCFGGTIHRHPDGWRWSDGSLEPRVSDETFGDAYDFTIRDNQFVEVPLFLADLELDLAWTKEADYEVSESRDPQYVLEFLTRVPQKRKEQIQSYLVPVADWNKRVAAIVGLRFSDEDAELLAEKSRSLGYDWPSPLKPGHVSGEECMEQPPLELKELKLVADAMNGINIGLTWSEWGWDALIKRNYLRLEVCDAICCDRLDLKWDVDAVCLLGKLKALSFTGRAMLALALAEFWNRCNDKNQESVFKRLLKDFYGAIDGKE
jgi:hypothetical protein